MYWRHRTASIKADNATQREMPKPVNSMEMGQLKDDSGDVPHADISQGIRNSIGKRATTLIHNSGAPMRESRTRGHHINLL
jgi:hypothetical protein